MSHLSHLPLPHAHTFPRRHCHSLSIRPQLTQSPDIHIQPLLSALHLSDLSHLFPLPTSALQEIHQPIFLTEWTDHQSCHVLCTFTLKPSQPEPYSDPVLEPEPACLPAYLRLNIPVVTFIMAIIHWTVQDRFKSKQPHRCHQLLIEMLLNSNWCTEKSRTNSDIFHVKRKTEMYSGGSPLLIVRSWLRK